jgi:hypothetical protein
MGKLGEEATGRHAEEKRGEAGHLTQLNAEEVADRGGHGRLLGTIPVDAQQEGLEDGLVDRGGWLPVPVEPAWKGDPELGNVPLPAHLLQDGRFAPEDMHRFSPVVQVEGGQLAGVFLLKPGDPQGTPIAA